MALELWIPETAREAAEPRTYLQCTLCDLKLPRDQRQQFLRHVKACAKKNEGLIEELIARREGNIFSGSMDPERERWIREREERNVTDIDYIKEGLVH